MGSKNQQEILNYLGSEYSLKEIDSELCIYRKINDRYDIEISGTNRRRHPMVIYVWDISTGAGISARIVEQFSGITDKSALKNTLNQIIGKYSDLT